MKFVFNVFGWLQNFNIFFMYRPLAVTSQLQLLCAMLEGKVKVWNNEMSTNVKRATRKRLLPDYYSILAIIFNIIHVFFSKTFFVLFCFPSNMAAKYANRHMWRHAKVVYWRKFFCRYAGCQRLAYTSGFKKHLYAPIGALLTNYSFKPIGAYKCFLKPDVYANLWHPA